MYDMLLPCLLIVVVQHGDLVTGMIGILSGRSCPASPGCSTDADCDARCAGQQ